MSILHQFIDFKMFNKCNFPYKWVESKLGCLKIVMFTKLANYLQRVEVINFKITIDARNALQETSERQSANCNLIGYPDFLQIWYWQIMTNKWVKATS